MSSISAKLASNQRRRNSFKALRDLVTTSIMLTIELASPMIEIGSMVPIHGEGDEFHARLDSFLAFGR